MLQPSPPRRQPKKLDYLRDNPRSYSPSEEHWQSQIMSLSYSRDIDEVSKISKRLEALAEQKEYAHSNKVTVGEIKKMDEVNDILIGSVRAKLNALGSVKVI